MCILRPEKEEEEEEKENWEEEEEEEEEEKRAIYEWLCGSPIIHVPSVHLILITASNPILRVKYLLSDIGTALLLLGYIIYSDSHMIML